MKKFYIVLFFIVCCHSFVQSQKMVTSSKPPLDTSVFSNWPSIYDFGISNDGKYVYYTTRDDYHKPTTLIVQSIKGNWKISFTGVGSTIAFSDDSRSLFFIKSKDSLCQVTLGSGPVAYFTRVNSYRLVKQANSEWLVYQHNNLTKGLILLNLQTEKKLSFENIEQYLISENGNTFVTRSESKKDSLPCQTVSIVDLLTGTQKVIWPITFNGTSCKVSDLVLNEIGSELVFTTAKTDPRFGGTQNQKDKTIWYYKLGTDKPVQLTNNQTTGIDGNFYMDRISRFTKDGNRLFIYLKENDLPKPDPGTTKVNIWSYTDAKIQSKQLAELRQQGPQSYLAAYDLAKNRIIRLQQENDVPVLFPSQNDDFVYIINKKGEDLEDYWSEAARPVCYIVSTADGKRRKSEVNISNLPTLSPDGKYLAGIDASWTDLYSMEVGTGKTRRVTDKISISLPDTLLYIHELDMPRYKDFDGFRFATWLDNENALIFDEFDIWKVDIKGTKAPVCLTGGYGRKNRIIFRFANLYGDRPFDKQQHLIISAHSESDRKNGFYKVDLNAGREPERLSANPYIYKPDRGAGLSPQKARDAEVYLLVRESAAQSPNICWTGDFKDFHPISDFRPEQHFNWFSSELKTFTTLDGRSEQGVLYKPENFDPTKKYPVILHYYQRMSKDLYRYYKPSDERDGGSLDIAWFVSNGYVVFTPDIHYRIGETGQSASNSIVAAANYLSNFPWVDPGKIGLQGHSFGGFETNYVVAHSNLFAAAISSSGVSNYFADYLSYQTGRPWQIEMRQYRIGASLWERPDLYIRNSPVFNAHQVTTPILTMANKNDGNVPFVHGLNWFMALRRLGKRAWMLEYDDGGHGVGGKDYVDYVIRSTQFFDHYLKGAPAPKWMLEGIPANKKGIDDGLELVREKDPKTGHWLTPKEGGLLPDVQNRK